MKLTKEAIFLTFNFFFLLFPFVAFQWKYDGYEYPKYLFLLLFGIIFGVFLLLSRKINLPESPVLMYLSFFLISVLFSNNFLYSFMGDYPRFGQSFVTIFSVLIISLVYKSYELKINIFQLVFYQSIFLTVITFFEKEVRSISTLGQPNFLGIILVLGIIYAIENYHQNKLFPAFSIFLIIGLVKTASVTSIFCLFIYLVFFGKKNFKQSWKKVLFLLTFLVSLTLLLPISRDKIIDNFHIISNSKDTKITDSILVRYSIWEDSIKIPFESNKNFLIGVGPENFSLYFEKYRSTQINFTSEWRSIIDKSHNFFLDIFLEQGIIGLIYFLLFLYFYFKTKSPNKVYTSIIIIYLLFNWAHVFLLLILFLELFISLINDKKIESNKFLVLIISIMILVKLFTLIIYKHEEIESVKNYYQSSNPHIKIEGLEFYSFKKNKEELVNYSDNLKKEYPNNLKIWFEIYHFEKKYNLPKKNLTKERIKEMRSDLVEWNEIFR